MKFYRIVVFGLLLLVASQVSKSQDYFNQALKFARLLEWIDKYYVDTVDQNKLVENAIIEVLEELDPHSTYLTPEEVKEMNEPLQGNFEGIGIYFNILNDTIYVVSPIIGGPSEKVGLMGGDRIVKVNGKVVAGTKLTNKDVYALLRGTKGTEVEVSVKRQNVKELLDYTIVRDKIPLYSIDASYMISGKVGYIKLSRFSMTSVEEFNNALKELKSKGLEKLILDLSGNGGGYLEVAFQLADEFLDNNKLIVYTEGIHNPKKEYNASSSGGFEKGDLVILIDEGSASASEIVSGAIQDWDRGIIVGRRSFGKGLVQRPLLFNDTSMVRLTIAKYYTPTGRLIQKPYDIGSNDYDMDIINRYENGELYNKDSIQFSDSLKYYTLIKKRLVYGGGGIMPDFFVPIDTSYYSDYYRDLMRKGIMNRFTLEYVDKNRNTTLKKFKTFDNYNSDFIVSDEALNDLIHFSEKDSLKSVPKDIKVSGDYLKVLIKAYIARDVWNNAEFYKVINTKDNKILKAIDVLENWDDYQKQLIKN